MSSGLRFRCARIALAGSLLLVSTLVEAQQESVIAEVLTYQQAATDAFERNDGNAIDSLLADDFTLTDSRGAISTKADAVAAARAETVRYAEFRNVDQRVRLYLDGNVALVTGRTLIRGTTSDGTSFTQDLPFTDTLVRLEGRWRMTSSHVSGRTP